MKRTLKEPVQGAVAPIMEDRHFPDCGTREALEALGISPEETEKIVSIIHRNRAE